MVKNIYIRILIPERRESFICRSAQVIDCVARSKAMGEREKYGGPQEHSEFQMTLLIFKSSLRIPKLYTNFEDITPNSKTSLRIRRHRSEFENFTPTSKRSKSSPFCSWCHGVPSSILSWVPIGIDCLQSAFFLKIYLILISPSGIANHHVTLQ